MRKIRHELITFQITDELNKVLTAVTCGVKDKQATVGGVFRKRFKNSVLLCMN